MSYRDAELRIDHARHHFFARAALAADEHRRVSVRHLLDGHLHIFHLRTRAEQHGKFILAAHLVANCRRRRGWFSFQYPRHPGVQFFQVHRLYEKIFSSGT